MWGGIVVPLYRSPPLFSFVCVCVFAFSQSSLFALGVCALSLSFSFRPLLFPTVCTIIFFPPLFEFSFRYPLPPLFLFSSLAVRLSVCLYINTLGTVCCLHCLGLCRGAGSSLSHLSNDLLLLSAFSLCLAHSRSFFLAISLVSLFLCFTPLTFSSA